MNNNPTYKKKWRRRSRGKGRLIRNNCTALVPYNPENTMSEQAQDQGGEVDGRPQQGQQSNIALLVRAMQAADEHSYRRKYEMSLEELLQKEQTERANEKNREDHITELKLGNVLQLNKHLGEINENKLAQANLKAKADKYEASAAKFETYYVREVSGRYKVEDELKEAKKKLNERRPLITDHGVDVMFVAGFIALVAVFLFWLFKSLGAFVSI